MDKKILNIATKAFNLTEDEAREKFFKKDGDKYVILDNFDEVFLTMNETRLKTFKDRETEQFNNGAKKREKEVRESIEKDLRELKITGDKYPEMIASLKELLSDDPGDDKKRKKGDPITDDDVKKHKLFLSLESSIKDKYVPVEKFQELEKKHTDFVGNFERNKKISSVSDQANKFINAMNPGFIFSEDKTIRQNQIQTIIEKVNSQYDDVNEDNGKLVFLKDGKRLENAQRHPKTLDDMIIEVGGSLFERAKQKKTGNSGNENDPGQGGGDKTYTGMIPEKYPDMMIHARTLPSDLAALLIKAWTEKYKK